MFHQFLASQLDQNKCAHCKFIQSEHKCEICDNSLIPVDLRYGNMLVCEPCAIKEDELTKANMTPEKQQERVNAHNDKMNILVANAREIDDKLKLSTDIFNAKTVAIIDLLKAIDNDTTIENKPFAKAEMLTERFNKMKSVIFEANKLIVDSTNEQKALQVQLNQIANTLRAEEREKLKIADINYKPKVQPVKVATIRTKSKKLDMAELKKYALELNVGEFTIRMLCIQKNCTVAEAANMLRKSINEAKSETN